MSFKLLIYNQECIDLAYSTLIKSDIIGKCTELQLYDDDLTKLTENRKDWLYYLNLSGEYHPVNERMTITSHDTLKEVEFSKATLATHSITKSKYTPTSQLTKDLINKYPNNAQLILGIIYALDIEDVINADEFSIVAYDPTLIDVRECDVMVDVERSIKAKFTSGINYDYTDIEGGFIDVLVWKLHQALPYEIKQARLARHRTAWASEFDMWTYINSRIYLEDLNYALSHNDIVYLYKNIDRLCRDSGSNSVLDELIDHFLTTRGVDTYRLELLRDLSKLEHMDISHELRLIEKQINGNIERPAALVDYERLGESRSHGTIDDYAGDLTGRMVHSSDTMATREYKILEILENSSDTQLLLTDIDLYVQAMTNGVFNSRHTIINHLTGDTYSLTTHEVIILYMYVVSCKLGNPLEYIMPYNTNVVPKTTVPTAAYLMDKYIITDLQASKILNSIPDYPTSELSQSEMIEYIEAYKSSIDVTRRAMGECTNYFNQVHIALMENEFFQVLNINLVPEKVLYQDWLNNQIIDLSEFQPEDYVLFEENILRTAFQLDLTERTSHRSIGIAELIKRFCSYRLNITARADSANLVNYHLRPLESNSTVISDNYIVTDQVIGVDLLSSSYDYHVKIEIEECGDIKAPSISNETPLRIEYGMSSFGVVSEVVTNPQSKINLGGVLQPDNLIEDL